MIIFIGSVFSPYYYWSGRRRPENHVCVNVALYGDGWQRWSMTERSARALSRGADYFQVAKSRIVWEGDALRLRLNERSVPHLTPLLGEIVLRPHAEMSTAYALDGPRRHWWRPIAPAATIELSFDKPAVSWNGTGYADSNWGAEPIEDGFSRWDWSRTPLRDGAAVLYDAERRDGTRMPLALRFDGRGGVEDFAPSPRIRMKNTLYGLRRHLQADPGSSPRTLRRLEEAPFYARTELSARLFGEDVHVMHENLDCDRVRAGWVKAMLPWRMPRIP